MLLNSAWFVSNFRFSRRPFGASIWGNSTLCSSSVLPNFQSSLVEFKIDFDGNTSEKNKLKIHEAPYKPVCLNSNTDRKLKGQLREYGIKFPSEMVPNILQEKLRKT